MSKLKFYLLGIVLSCFIIFGMHQSAQANLKVLTGDSDGDGVFNAQELMWGTNMYSKDTDGDGYEDGRELEYGYDPKNPLWGARFLPIERVPQIKTAGLWVHGPSHLEGSVVAEDQLDVADELNAMGVATFGRGIIVAQATTSNLGGTIFNGTKTGEADNPLTVGDNLRVDGAIWRWQQGEADGRRVIVRDGLDVWDTLLVGGGYGATGTTIDPAGNTSMNGNLQVDGTIQSGISSILINGPQHNIRSSQALTVQTQAGRIVLYPQNRSVILKRGGTAGDERAAVGGIVKAGGEPILMHGLVGIAGTKFGEIHFPKPIKNINYLAGINITPIVGEDWVEQGDDQNQIKCTAYTVHIRDFIGSGGVYTGLYYEVRRIYSPPQEIVNGNLYRCWKDQGAEYAGVDFLHMEDVTDKVPVTWTVSAYE